MNDEQRKALVALLYDQFDFVDDGSDTFQSTVRCTAEKVERLLTDRAATAAEPDADAVDVFDAADSDSWPPPEMKDAPLIRYLHKVMKYHQPTITPSECWVAIGAFRMWMSRNPDRASEMLQSAVEPEPGLDELLNSVEAAFVSVQFKPEHLRHEALIMGYDSSWAHRGYAETRREAIADAVRQAKGTEGSA